VAEEREGIRGSSSTNLCREWSNYSRDNRRGRIHVSSWPEAVGSSSWSGTTLTDPHQPSLGWLGRRLHASNRVLVTVVTQGAVGLEKSRAAAGREQRRRAGRERQMRAGRERRRRAGRVATVVGRVRTLWICLARSWIWTMCVTVFNETTGVPLTTLCCNWNFMGIIVNIGGWKDQCKWPRGGWIGLQNKLDQFLPTSAQTPEPPGKCTLMYFLGASGNLFLWWFAVWNKVREQQYCRELVTRS
jgi:hypothetical protein